VSKNKRKRVLVIGDVMLDHYTYGQVKRISPEAPVPVLEFDNERWVPGGAGNVAANLASLGADVTLFGVVGHDPQARKLVQVLDEAGVKTVFLAQEKGRHTTVKQRVFSGQQIVRIDRESRRSITEYQEKQLIKDVYRNMLSADAIIISDYAKGVVTQFVVEAVIGRANEKKIPVMMNMKPGNTVNPHEPFAIQVNRKEAFEFAHTYDDGSWSRLRETAAVLATRWEPRVIIITLGADGIYLYRSRSAEPIHLPTDAKEVVDVSGAGDTVIAAYTFSIVNGASSDKALKFANEAAGQVVAHHGTAAVSLREL
jgi:rfaE bifunctional protein kinase chain/domain